MKSIIKLLGRFVPCAVIMTAFLTSCEFIGNLLKPEGEETEVTLISPKTLEADPEGESFLVEFSSTMSWTAEFTFLSDEKWMSLDKALGTRGDFSLKLTVQPNRTGKQRKASLKIAAEEITVTVTVNQKAADAGSQDDGKTFKILSDNAEISALGGLVEVEVIPGEGYTMSVEADWIHKVETKASQTDVLVFQVDENKTADERVGMISFCSAGTCIPYTITQEAGSDSSDDGDDEGKDDDKEWKGNVETEWEDKVFHHTSVAMRFTADWCGYCPMMAEAFDGARESLGGNLEVISMHCDGGLKFAPSRDLMSQYGVSGFPTGIIDGWKEVLNYEIPHTKQLTLDAVGQTSEKFDTYTGMGWTVEVAGNEVNVYLAAYIKEAGTYKLTVMAVEDGIKAYQNGEGNNYIHNGVPRVAFTSIKGDTFTSKADEVSKFSLAASIPSGCNADNMRIVAYIQRSLGTYSSEASGDYGGYFIDNSATSGLDEDHSLEFSDKGSTEDINQGDDINIQ